MEFFSTKQVGAILNVSPDTITKAIWLNRLDPPAKGPSGSYLWQAADIERAAWALSRWNEFKRWQKSREVADEN